MIIKLQYGEDTRRVSQPDNFTYEQLLNVVSEKFGLKDFHLRYPDEDGDLITINSELDMAEARRLGNSVTGLKVVVQPGLLASQLRASLVPSPNPKLSSSSPAPSPPPVEQKPAQPAADITGLMGDVLAQSGITPNLLSSLSKCKSAQEVRELIPQLSGVPALQQLATYMTSPAMATSLQALLPLVVNLVSQVTTGPLTQSTIVPPVKSDPMVPASLLEMFGINLSTNPAPLSMPAPSSVKAPGPSPAPSPVPSSSPSSVSPVAAPPSKELSVLERLESIMEPLPPASPITIPSAPVISPAPSPVLGQPATPTASPIATLPVASPVASQQPVPDNLLRSVGPFNPLNARFVTDLSVPDGTLLEPNQPFVKTWRFQNVGSVMWPVGTRLECIAGNSMGGQAVVVTAAPGETVEISVPLIAPPAPGRFCGYWRLHAPDGLLFGHRVWVDVFVRVGAPAPSPAPVVPAQATAPGAPVPVAEPLAPLPPSVPLDKQTQEDQDLKIALALAELELSEQREDELKRKEEAARKRAEELQREQQRRDEDRRRKEEEGRSLEQRRKEQQAAGLATIKAMGFDNEDLIAQMLAKHNGDVALALNELINLLG